MFRQKSGNIEWLQFDLLSEFTCLQHAIFLRHGGSSQGPFASLNTSFNVGDLVEHVTSNLNQITQLMPFSSLTRGKGIHGNAVAVVDKNSPDEIPDVDGLITDATGMTLMMTHADCQIAFFYDPIEQVIANVHSGWRGSAMNIYGEAIQKMVSAYGSKPSNLLACISPSLGPEYSEFIHYRREIPEQMWQFQIRPTYFDFWSITEHQLKEAGILPQHIEIARLCTYSNPDDFFSYRRDKLTGRNAAFITLRA